MLGDQDRERLVLSDERKDLVNAVDVWYLIKTPDDPAREAGGLRVVSLKHAEGLDAPATQALNCSVTADTSSTVGQ